MTPVMEALWPKRRIIEVYLNVIEFDKSVFGVGAASQWYFGIDAADLSDRQAAALAVVLPDPKNRSAKNPTKFLKSRARRAQDGPDILKHLPGLRGNPSLHDLAGFRIERNLPRAKQEPATADRV